VCDMIQADTLSAISNEDLFVTVRRLTARSNVALADLLAHLGEVERRGIHRLRACPSLYIYCIYELRMSEDAAYRRSKAARLVRELAPGGRPADWIAENADSADSAAEEGIAESIDSPAEAATLPEIPVCALHALVQQLRSRKRAATKVRPAAPARVSDDAPIA